MLRNIIFSLLFLLSLGVSTSFAQKSVSHSVSSGETFYAICRKYNVSSADVLKANPGLNIDKLSLGQKITIPGVKAPVASTTKPPVKPITTTTTTSTPVVTKQSGSTHTVQKGETGYSIAKMYGLTYTDLKTLNNLSADNIQVGQVLVVSQSATISKTPVTTSTPVKTTQVASSTMSAKTETNQVKSATNSVTESEDPTDPTVNRTDIRTANSIRNNATETKTASTEVYQISATQNLPLQEQFQAYVNNDQLNRKIIKGVANYLSENTENASYIALYNGCPIGTVLKVRNLMNNKSVYLKVVGKLPEVDASKDISVKISGTAAKALGALDEKFLAEVTSFVPRN